MIPIRIQRDWKVNFKLNRKALKKLIHHVASLNHIQWTTS